MCARYPPRRGRPIITYFENRVSNQVGETFAVSRWAGGDKPLPYKDYFHVSLRAKRSNLNPTSTTKIAEPVSSLFGDCFGDCVPRNDRRGISLLAMAIQLWKAIPEASLLNL